MPLPTSHLFIVPSDPPSGHRTLKQVGLIQREHAKIAVLKTSCVYSGDFAPTENKTVYDPAEMARVTCPLRSKTLIVSRMNTPDLVGAAAYVSSSVEGLFLPDRLWQVTFYKDADPRWVHYWTKTPSYRDQLKAICVGTSSSMQNISQADFGSLVIALPSRHEQAAITRFLDRETAKIDVLIAKQEQLIAALREDRTATITHSVSKGLDPAIATKDSGVEWLDEVPQHWQLVPIKHVVRSVGVGLVINPSTYVADSGVPFLLGRNVRDGWIDLANVNYMSEEDSRRLKASRLNAGDVVVVRAGYPGRAAVIPPELEGANCASILILRKPTLARPEFVAAFFNSVLGHAQVQLAQYGAAQEQINVGDVVNFLMPVPPMSEQLKILERISAAAGVIDALIAKATNVIDTLREYRGALITDAVTGKIDVRGAA